jgi:hypothetical protein
MANVSGQKEKGETKRDAHKPGVPLLFKIFIGLDDCMHTRGYGQTKIQEKAGGKVLDSAPGSSIINLTVLLKAHRLLGAGGSVSPHLLRALLPAAGERIARSSNRMPFIATLTRKDFPS